MKKCRNIKVTCCIWILKIKYEQNSFVIDLKITLKGYYEGKVEFYRDEIDVRVESLKGELDKIRDSLHQKLDEAKEKTFKYF